MHQRIVLHILVALFLHSEPYAASSKLSQIASDPSFRGRPLTL